MFNELLDFTNDTQYSIAILIAKTRYGNNHTGILTKINDEIFFYHLAWHLQLDCNEWNEILQNTDLPLKRWVKFTSLTSDPVVAEFRVPAIEKFLKLIYAKNQSKIPYSLKFKDTLFTNQGDLELGENENGLTCATFVASFFNSVAIELADLNTWIDREPEDSNWKSFVIEMMNKTGVPYAHIAGVAKEEINFRLKPEEITVASSKIEEELPANYNFCSVVGAEFNNIVA